MAFMKIEPGTPMVRMFAGENRSGGVWENFVPTEVMTFTDSTVFPSPASVVRWPEWATGFAREGILSFRAEWKINRHTVYYAMDVKDLSAKNLETLWKHREKIKYAAVTGAKLSKDQLQEIYNMLIDSSIRSAENVGM